VLPENAEVTLIVLDLASRVAEAVPVTERDRIARAVETLYVGGGTNLVTGWERGIKVSFAVMPLAHDSPDRRRVYREPTRERCVLIRDAKISLTTSLWVPTATGLAQWLDRTNAGIFHACTDAVAFPVCLSARRM
jgi:hypothetical protein